MSNAKLGFAGYRAQPEGVRLQGRDAVAEEVDEGFGIFGEDAFGVDPPARYAKHALVRRHGDEFDVGCEMLEGVKGAAGMIPGGDDDGAFRVLLAENRNGELGVFGGGCGLALEID